MDNENMQVFDWDSVIENDGADFTPLPEGDYLFEVTKLEKGYYSGSAKMPACPRADLTLKVHSEDMSRSITVFDSLYLCAKTEWRISAFLRSIGKKKHGQKVRVNWDGLVGASGIVHLLLETPETNPNISKNRNKVGSYLDHDDVKPVTSVNDFKAVPNATAEEIPFV